MMERFVRKNGVGSRVAELCKRERSLEKKLVDWRAWRGVEVARDNGGHGGGEGGE